MKVLVLGGTRFLGIWLLNELMKQNHDITVLNRGKTKSDIPDSIKRLSADRRDAEAVKNVLAGQEFDVVFDLTGYELRNVEPVVEMFAGKIKHYVFQSTAAVYAEPRTVPMLEDYTRLDREHPGKSAEAAYGIGKAECEDYLVNKFKSDGFPVTILRCPVIYGAYNWMHEREFSYFIRLLQGRTVLLPGNGLGLMQFTYTGDLARCYIEVLGKEKTFGQAYNIAHFGSITTEGYVDTIAEILGVEAKKAYLDYSVMAELKQPVFPFIWNSNAFLSVHKAIDDFGFKPAYDMKSGLKETYEWWQKNLGVEKTRFEPGRMGFNVDFAFEDELIKKYGK